jgi:tetratricopeptide (TPR) repeat protein
MDRLADAKFALENHDHQTAYELAEAATGADERERRRVMAKAMVRAGSLDKAEALYREAVGAAPDDADTKTELSLLLVASGREQEAEGLLMAALDRDAEHHRALGALGLIALSRGDIDRAIGRFVQALEIEIDNAPIVARLLDCAATREQYNTALPVARRYVDFYPGKVDIALRLAETLHAAGETREALDRLDTLLLLQPGHPAAIALLARIHGTAS